MGERMIRAAYVTLRPVPDVVYSYWLPREIFEPLSHASLVVRGNRRRSTWPVQFLKNQMWTFGPLYGGIGPGCGDNTFQDYHWNYSLNMTGLGQYADQTRMKSYFDRYLST